MSEFIMSNEEYINLARERDKDDLKELDDFCVKEPVTCKMCGKNGVLKESDGMHYYQCESCMQKTEYRALEPIAKYEWAKLNKGKSYCIECNKHIAEIFVWTRVCEDCLEPKCNDCECSNCNTPKDD